VWPEFLRNLLTVSLVRRRKKSSLCTPEGRRKKVQAQAKDNKISLLRVNSDNIFARQKEGKVKGQTTKAKGLSVGEDGGELRSRWKKGAQGSRGRGIRSLL